MEANKDIRAEVGYISQKFKGYLEDINKYSDEKNEVLHQFLNFQPELPVVAELLPERTTFLTGIISSISPNKQNMILKEVQIWRWVRGVNSQGKPTKTFVPDGPMLNPQEPNSVQKNPIIPYYPGVTQSKWFVFLDTTRLKNSLLNYIQKKDGLLNPIIKQKVMETIDFVIECYEHDQEFLQIGKGNGTH